MRLHSLSSVFFPLPLSLPKTLGGGVGGGGGGGVGVGVGGEMGWGCSPRRVPLHPWFLQCRLNRWVPPSIGCF